MYVDLLPPFRDIGERPLLQFFPTYRVSGISNLHNGFPFSRQIRGIRPRNVEVRMRSDPTLYN